MTAPERSAARLHAPNTRIGGKYLLLRRLATGGMGDVWLARNETTEAQVALKILRPDADEKTQAEERFRREARLGGLLAHRSIVRIFDFLEERDGTLVLVMELLRGETLEHWITRRGPTPQREAMAVIAAVLSALHHGHEQGVVHRDVKPSNIFLAVEPDGRVIPKLLDYGIAKMPKNDTSKTIDGMVLGTPSYMSPEQIRSEPDIDGRSDLFSCAVVLYEMLTAVCPFQAPSPSAAIAAVLQNAVDPDARIEPRIWLELQRALSKRPKQRHASAGEMLSTLLAAAGETEDSLASALRGIAPSDYSAPTTGPVSSRALREAQTQSVEGQSVASVLPPHRAGWVPWALGGAILGSIAVIAVMSSRGAGGAAMAPARAMAGAAAIATVTAPATATMSTTGAATATPAPLPTPASAAIAVSASATMTPPRGAHAVRHPAPKPHTPRPVATSPGF